MRRIAIFLLVASATAALGIAEACSSFGADSSSGDAAADGAADATPEAGATDEAGPVGDGGAPPRALYVFGGLVPDDAGGASDNAPPIVAAPINDDGSLGDWTTLTATLPFAMARGAGAVLDGRIYLAAGTSSAGGAQYDDKVMIATRTTGLELSIAKSIAASSALERYRVQYASDGTSLYVIGGELAGLVTLASTVVITPSGDDDVVFGDGGPLPGDGGSRGAAAAIGNRIMLFGGSGPNILTSTTDGGTNTPFAPTGQAHSDFDMAAASNPTTYYVTGGQNNANALYVFEPAGASVSQLSVVMNVAARLGAVVATERFVYVLGGSDHPKQVLIGTIDQASHHVTFVASADMPVGRIEQVALAY